MPQSKGMLAPQFSLRRLLALVTVSGVGCFAAAFAPRGHVWALAVLVAFAGLALLLLICGLTYLLILAIGDLLERRQRRATARRPPAQA